DTTAANEGGAYRQDAVDIEVGGSNYNVGWIRPTEFLTYSVDVPTGAAGAYTIAFRMANPSGAKSFNVFVDGVSVGTVNLPATGSFNTWTTVQTPSVQMTEGRHVIKVDFVTTTSINFDYMQIQGGAPVTTTTTVVTTTTTAQPTTGGASFTAAPIPVKKGAAIKFTVTPATGKTIRSAWWTFDKTGHYSTWNSRTINPTFYYPAVGTYTPLVILTYTDGTTETVERAGYVRVIA
ncbi:MAG TPA: carbohydrate-binding protein, partial [Methanoregulaceae archaeon]|nr:carbohydrate-binding protein [Methanoregulaceae archaeon]